MRFFPEDATFTYLNEIMKTEHEYYKDLLLVGKASSKPQFYCGLDCAAYCLARGLMEDTITSRKRTIEEFNDFF